MKLLFTSLAFAVACIVNPSLAQKQSLAILHIESHGIRMDSAVVNGLVAIEVEKTGLFVVADKYDIEDALGKAGMELRSCRSRECLSLAGRTVKADKVLTGSVTNYTDKIVVSLRLINATTDKVETTHVEEFLNLNDNLQDMIGISVKRLFGLPTDEEMYKSLTNRDNYDNAMNNPNETTVNLSGPRTGFTLFTGEMANAYAIERKHGGYGIQPWLWNFGWQFETQFVNAGYSQALFEVLLNVAGVEKGMFVPSMTMFIGYRYNKYGIEAGVGPIFSVVNVKAVPNVVDGQLQLDANGNMQMVNVPSPSGDPKFTSGLVIAAGKSFKSGRMNFPISAYVIPRAEGASVGISCGFNVKKKQNRRGG